MRRWVLRTKGEIERTNEEGVVCEIGGEGLGGERLKGVVKRQNESVWFLEVRIARSAGRVRWLLGGTYW